MGQSGNEVELPDEVIGRGLSILGFEQVNNGSRKAWHGSSPHPDPQGHEEKLSI